MMELLVKMCYLYVGKLLLYKERDTSSIVTSKRIRSIRIFFLNRALLTHKE